METFKQTKYSFVQKKRKYCIDRWNKTNDITYGGTNIPASSNGCYNSTEIKATDMCYKPSHTYKSMLQYSFCLHVLQWQINFPWAQITSTPCGHVREWTFPPLEVSSELHALVALTTRKKSPVPIL
jgi:hypothetical protein